MAIKFPSDCNTPNNRLEYCFIAMEKLRLQHNAKGKDFREGKITKSDWEKYLSTNYLPKENVFVTELLTHKKALQNSARWDPDLKVI